MIRGQFLVFALLLAGCSAAAAARAEPAPVAAVGRVAAVEGKFEASPAAGAAAGDWSDWGLNHPVPAGMAVRSGESSGAVLRIGGDAVALAASSAVDLVQLDDRTIDIVLHRGRIAVRLSPLDLHRIVEIDLPQGAVWLTRPGDYDIRTGDAEVPAQIVVLGSSAIAGPGASPDSVPTAGDVIVAPADETAADAFAAWWQEAAGGAAGSEARRYLPAAVTGSDTLDGNGSWETLDRYGAVWFPASPPDSWAPYRDGHWRWIAPWGWTWIDDLPWGFATSHYGRWAMIAAGDSPGDPGKARWGWVPGDLGDRPIYAPALVAFLGTAGVGLSYADGSGPAVAWFPLAPGEAYWPPWSADPDVIRRLNNGVAAELAASEAAATDEPPADIVNGRYANRRFASAVPRAVFLAGKPVAPALLAIPERRLDNAPLLAGSPGLAPPAPRPAPAAVAAAIGRGKHAAAPARLARAVHTLARILKPHGRGKPVRLATLSRARHAAPAAGRAIGGHWRTPRLRTPKRPMALAAASGGRLRLAASHRRKPR